ncbi:MFS transporter [Streptacidiphilus anmyonensis]|uniref:MFS transporter n=1 Tax=Streptacidiphilus anmyonensis TaxID=405782 RepID=UPI000A63F02A|nr:MFS transporter [Streptacidiphilus anmyonensis]
MARGDSGRFVLPIVLVGTFMAILDVAIVNVAIPSIRSGLSAGFGAVELVVSAYTIAYASLLVTGGRLGDILGRKRMFVAGLLVFTAASALCGAAPDIAVLVVARVLQGVGGAMLYPQVLAIIQTSYQGEARGRALGAFGAVIGIAAIAGQLIGGALLALDLFGWTWRPVFLVNVPVGVLAAVAALLWLPDDRDESRTRLDLGGAGLVTALLLLLSVPLLLGRDQGWPLWLVLMLVAALPVGWAFLRWETRVAARGGQPLVRLDLFRNRGFASGVPIAVLFQLSYAGFLFTLAVYLQTGLDFSPLKSALVYTPSAVGFFCTSLLAPRLVPVLGRHVLAIGYVLAAFGLFGTAATAAAAGASLSVWALAPTMLLTGVGQGLGMSPLVGTILSSVPPKDAGGASGVVTTSMQTGNVLGVALFGLTYFTLVGTATHGAAYATAFGELMPLSAVLLLAAAFLVYRMPQAPGQPANALVERLPGWAGGFAWSMFLATGGRVGDQLFNELLTRVRGQRLDRAGHAPEPFGEFLAFHYRHQEEADAAWLAYLQREALAYGDRPIPREEERTPVIRAQIAEIARRQAAGRLDPELDPALFRLMCFGLASYPTLLPQVTRMATGMSPHDPEFVARWEEFLGRIGAHLESVCERN